MDVSAWLAGAVAVGLALVLWLRRRPEAPEEAAPEPLLAWAGWHLTFGGWS